MSALAEADTSRPTDRAMKCAVMMEVHCALSTQTIGKAKDIDQSFPAYDDVIEALTEAFQFIGGVRGTAIALAMSGKDNPNLDSALMGLNEKGEAVERKLRAALTRVTGEAT